MPVCGSTVRPMGRPPNETDHTAPVEGASLAWNWMEYGTPTVAGGKTEGVVICGMPMVKLWVPGVLVGSWGAAAVTVNWYVPAWDGVPEKSPPEVNVRPGGREPAETDQVMGVFAPVDWNCTP